MIRNLTLALIATFTVVGALPAQSKKPATLRDFPFWSAPKRPHAQAFVPGLQVVLHLTAEQVQKIEAACQETIDRPEAKVKGNSGEAQEKVHRRVSEILTAEQKKKIEQLNDLYAKVQAKVSEEFQDDIVANKGNDDGIKRLREEMTATIRDTYREKLASVLTNEEFKAVETAAEEQKKRDEANKNKPKPNK